MKTRGANIALYWGPVFIWMVGIYLLSNTTLSTLGQIKEGSALLPWYVSKAVTSEYVVHTFEFGVLAVLVYRLLLSIQALRIRSVLLITLAWAVAFGILDEIHQSFVAGRHSSLSDVGLDSAGAFIAVALVFRLGYFRR
ncbi:MAG: VanZ family protein [Chloroflexi bacterium]|nr:VanZ family protein [Chloroflexota bacterium]MCH8869372.1 VanZ family protein [Chloroflexota bacterium]MCH9038963.1 VanZ family protein [Chloroflexota bacterium]